MAQTITSNRGGIRLDESDRSDSPLTINSGVTVSGGAGYAVYTSYYQSWSVTNLGTLLGKYGALLNDADTSPGSVLTNSGAAAFISGTDIGVEVFGSFSTVTNQGTILGGSGDGVDLDADSDSVTNSGGALIQGGRDGVHANTTPGSTAVVANSGTISGTSADGVFLTGGGSVTNSTTGALIEGGTNGVAAAGTSTAVVTNFGTINGASGDGVSLAAGGKVTNSGTGAAIYGGTNGVYATNASVAVVNTGLVLTTNNDGVYLDAGGTVTNNSTLAVIDGYVYGVRVNGAAGTVTNLGHIIGNVAGVDFLNGGTLANNGTAALVSGLNWGAYFGASGGAVTVTNQGTILGKGGNGVNLGDGGALTNSGTGALISGKYYGIAAAGQYLTLVNTGRISGSNGRGVYLGAGATLTNSATAQIDGAASGILANNNAVHVANQGTIAGTGTTGVGVDVEFGGTLTNSGTGALIYGATYGIQAVVQSFTVVNYAKISAHSGAGAYFGAGGSVTNATSAQIDGATDGILASNTAIYVVNQGTIAGTTVAGIDLGAGGTVTNSGTAALISGAKYGIEALGGAVTVSNQGSIVGTGNYGLFLGDGGVVTNSAGAVIYGGFDGIYNQSGGALTLTNLGSITTGSGGLFGVNVQAGGLVLNTGTGASIAGEGGGLWAQNVAATVSNQGRIVGTNNLGVYLGAGGTVTNSGTAALISGALYGITIHSGAATVIDQGTISGATAAVKFADTIGNVLELYPGAKLSGVVRGAGGTAKLVLGSAASAGTVSGISSEYVGFGAFDVDAGAHWTMSGSNTLAALATLSVAAAATLTVSGKLVSLGQPTLEGSGTIDLSGTGAIEVGTNNNATAGEFLIDATRTVVTDGAVSLNNVLNRGVVTGLANYGLYLGAGGTVNNGLLAARISGQDDGIFAKRTATIQNQGTITGTSGSGVYLGDGGSVTNTGTAALISGNYGVKAKVSAAAVANFGSIISTSFVGVYLGAGGSVTNASTASIISGKISGVEIRYDPGNITNLGTINGAGSEGVVLGGGGSVTNSGTAAVISGKYGIEAYGSAATVANLGTIIGSLYGVHLVAGGTVTNSGTIGGEVKFFAGFANRLVVDPGAVFTGTADGGNAVGSGTISTLEFAGGASAGTLHGLGSHYVNFAQTTIDAGATWTLTGSNSLASGATLTNSGTFVLSGATLTDSGVLINSGGITLDPSTLTVGTLLGTGVVTVDTGGMLEAQGTVTGGETITFAGSNAELHLDTPDSVSGSVANVGLGDLIDLKGIAPGSVQYADGTLSFTGGSFPVSLNGTPAVQVVSSGDGAVFEVVGPVITGTASDQPVTDEATIDPFSGVAITDANAGQTETVTVTLSNAANGTLSTSGAGNVSDGIYTDAGTADQVTTALQDLVFTPTLDPGPLGHTITTTFTIQASDTAGATATDSTTSVVASAAPALVTLVTFDGTGNGAMPLGGLIADTAGDLFGTTSLGGGDSDGTVFEIAKSGGVYASTPTTLVTFNGSNGALPQAGLITDAAGDLLGTTAGGGADGAGTVFEITLSSGSYSNSPTTLATFADTNNIGYRPVAGVIADTAGDLFGTVHFPSGANDGAVFEIANGTTTVTQVVGFTGGEDGGVPKGALLLDAAGDLFGTTNIGGAGGQGTVFEIANTATGYATTATPLVSFTGGDDGANPLGGLITDANGDLFGTTSNGGHDGDGTVFEIANTATGYATTATPLATFDGTGNGANPADTLIADAAGDLFGTTQNGGADGHGTVFEIANTATGYAISPITLATFNGTGNGANPYGGLIADSSGDLFGTTQNGGASGDGTAFQVVSTGATFAPLISGTAANQAVTDRTTIDPFAAVTLTDGNSGQTETVTVTLSDAANGTLLDLGTGNFNDGVYSVSGTAAQVTAALDGLVFAPAFDTGPLGHTITTTFTIKDTDTAGATAADSTTSVVASAATALVTLATFDGTDNGATPFGGLIADGAGDLFGTTSLGGGDSDGTVFEIAKSGGVYASTPTTLVTFNGSNGALPQAGLITDAAGDLLGTTAGGGADGAGTVFEITLSSGSYSNSPTTLATFADTNNIGYRPVAGVIADTAGDLFGTVHFPSGANDGAVFEIANGTTTVTQVVGFTGGEDGGVPKGALLLDAAGDLFGTTNIGGAGGQGTVFEIANTATGYATTATPLVSFTGGDDGANPLGGLITDANGDLFGTTSNGGHDGDGTVFEIANTATGYATTATPLATFDGTGNGANPADTLIADAAGDLFGTTQNGGADGDGTVFEIANTATGYAISPITLATFNGTGNGANPYGGLIADPAGDLFGTTQNGGASGDGTAFEVVSTGATFAPLITGTAANQAVTDQTTIDPFAAVTLTDGNSGQTETVTVTLSDAANGTLSELANGNFNNGVYTDVGTAAEITAALDGLVFIPTEGQVPLGQTVTTTFTIQDADTAGAIATDDTTSVVATAVCFCAGTLIRTPGGEAPVEKLAAGDHVVTLSGVARRIVWIGSGKVMVARGRRSAATPVIVRKGAIAENVPNRDLHVTKGHSFYLDDVLIPVEFLINHRTILWDDWAQEVTIYHVELETHDILLANSAPAESYRDDGNRWLFQNANSGWDQPPSEPCAPILTGGPVVDAIWLRLLERAGPRTDLPLTDEPDLHLLVDGKRIDATAQRDSMFVFRLRGKPRSVRLRSRAAVPQELGLSRDPRCLGVAVRRLVLAEARRQRAIEAEAVSLTDGYHAFEAVDGIRWTDGDAAVPAELFAGMSGPGMLMVQLGGAAQYVADGVVGRAA